MGTVNQTGGKISLVASASSLTVSRRRAISDAGQYLQLAARRHDRCGNIAAAGNNGINVRNGIFNMTGGAIVDDTLTNVFGQRANDHFQRQRRFGWLGQ